MSLNGVKWEPSLLVLWNIRRNTAWLGGGWKSCHVADKQSELLCPSTTFIHCCAMVWFKQEQETPSPPCYLITATSHTGTLGTLCSGTAKYKTTGRHIVYIFKRWLMFFFPRWIWDNFTFEEKAINCSYLAENRRLAWVTGSIWWSTMLPGGASYFSGLGFGTISQYLRYPQQNTKKIQTKPQSNCKICY